MDWLKSCSNNSGNRCFIVVLLGIGERVESTTGFLTGSDEIITISHDPNSVMTYLEGRYILKEGRVKEPDTYLGADVQKIQID